MKTFWHRKSGIGVSGVIGFLAIFLISTAVYAGSGKKVKIGVIGPMQFMPGEQLWWGADMAAEDINKAGGITIKGVKHDIELIKSDSNELKSIADAVNAMEKLIAVDKVNAVTGGYATEAVMAMQELTADYKTIYLGGAGSPKLTLRVAQNYDKYKYYFRVIHVNAIAFTKVGFSIMEMAVAKIKKDLGIKKVKVALLLDKLKVAEPFIGLAKKYVPQMGGEVCGVWRTSLFANDLTIELTAIKKSGAQIIFTFLAGPSGIIFSKQWGELQIPAVPIGFNTESFSKRHWKVTGGMCEYETLYTAYGPAELTKKTIPFYKKFTERTNEFPAYYGGTYDALYVYKEAVERAGTLNSDAVVKELEKTKYLGAAGLISFSQKGSKLVHEKMFGPGHVTNCGVQWRDGKLLVIWPVGKTALGDKRYEGLKYKGTVDYKLPPWMVKYWKTAKNK